MNNNPSSRLDAYPREQRLVLLFANLAKTESSSLIAYCIKFALLQKDYEEVLSMLKSLRDDDEFIISSIYGDEVLHLLNSL